MIKLILPKNNNIIFEAMKKVILFIGMLLLFSCSDKEINCINIFTDTDTSIFYYSKPYEINGLCVQNMKFNGRIDEYGNNLLVKDTVIVFKDNSGIYYSDNRKNPLESNHLLLSYTKKQDECFFDSILKDTICRVSFDAKLKNISNSNVFLYLVIGKRSGIKGLYIHDKSDYILKHYSRSVIRSIRGNIYPSNIDTASVIINNGSFKGVYY
jgi:hypothetical protein